MSLQDQLRKLTTGGPGVTHIASETLFEDSAKELDRYEAEVARLHQEVDFLAKFQLETERLRQALKEVVNLGDCDDSAKNMYWAARNALNSEGGRT